MDFFPPKHIGDWLTCLAVVMIIGKYAIWYADRVRGKPQTPPNGELEKTQKELARRIEENEENQRRLEARMREDKEQILASGSNRGKTIYSKIDDTRRELQTELSHLRQRFEPVIENQAFIKGSMEAFTESFRNFTAITKSNEQKKSQ